MNAELGARLACIFEALIITDEYLGAGVAQGIVHFVLGPPGVHRHRYATRNENAGKAHRPLRIVAHGHRHAITLLDAIDVHQTIGERIHMLEGLGERPTLTFIDQEILVAMPTRQTEDLGKVRWRMLEHLHVHPAHVGIDEFEHLSR